MIDKLAPGCPWRDLPERYGPWQSVYGRYRRWANDGTVEAILRHVQVRHDAVGRIQWEVGIDSTVVALTSTPPAHQKGTEHGTKQDQALGRSRGGLTTQVHLATGGRGLPLALVITTGNTNDSTVFAQLMDTIHVPRPGPGRPRTRPERVIADKA